VLGVSVDPSFDTPMPLVGIDYLNFDFLHRGLQFGVVFSGVLGAGNIQKTNIGGSKKFDASLDFYGIAVKSNDQVYDADGERKDERLQNRTVSTGVNLGYQATAFQKITANTHVQYDQYMAARDVTSLSFRVPASPLTTSAGFNYEYRRGGYSLLGSWTWFGRSAWTTWGDPSAFDPSTRTYQKYNAGLSKDFIFGALSKLHVNAGYYAGRRLDRFSMYRSGLFDETRMRGVPAAGIRFSELALFRAAYSYNLFGLFRLAAYVDHARGRTPDVSAWQPTTGVGFEVNLAGPKATLLKFGFGKGFLPNLYKGSGSVVAEFMLFKPL
jgi:hypothetical protein